MLSEPPLGTLNGRRFTMEDLAAIGMDGPTVFNLVHRPSQKTSLRLCSEEPGRGRARKFCLIDVYCLRLAREIVLLTKSADAAVAAINTLLVNDIERERLKRATDAEIAEFSNSVCEDIRQAPQPFWERNPLGVHWYLHTHALDVGFDLSRGLDFIHDRSMTRRRLVFVDVTQVLIDVDDQLVRIIEDRYGRNA